MDKRTLARTLEALIGSPFASIGQLEKALKMSRHTLYPYLSNLEYLPIGKSKRYLVDDVSAALCQTKRLTGSEGVGL